MEDIKTGITFAAFLLSSLAFIFTRRTWFESNRPIVSAEIVTHGSGNVGITFSLVVHNTGNRPASDIRLYAPRKEIDSAIQSNAPEALKNEILACFSDDALIPILHQGKSVSNGFGNTSIIESEGTLVYNSIISVVIKYKDLYGKSYKTVQKLIVKDSSFFAGSGWANNG